MPEGPQLADIHLPGAPSWWPPSPGWWVLGVALMGLVVMVAWWWRRRWQQARLRAMLRSEFQAILAATSLPGDEARQVAALSILLRRAAMRFAPQSATLQGEAWLHFLDADDPARPFTEGPGRVLIDGPYRASVNPDAAKALVACVGPRLLAFAGARDA
ncbi:DUF4381 domain-containing protein [Xanthomonadaceae bacterium JHOS43]|nr:DUF4381 domain-containing protein [Xanthomonadaceae bacterium JHOS43]